MLTDCALSGLLNIEKRKKRIFENLQALKGRNLSA
jgi:hypothetical protein